MKQKLLIRLAVHLYRISLFLYPTEYRQEYGDLMTQIFKDASRERWQRRGAFGLLRWWCTTFIDLLVSVTIEWQEIFITGSEVFRSRATTGIALILCLPAFVANLTSVLGLELPFNHLITIDGVQTSVLGYIIMLLLLVGLPASFLINLLSMIRRTDNEPPHSFKPTRGYILIGLSILLVVFMIWSGLVRYELHPLLAQLEAASGVVLTLFLLVLLVMPIGFLFNLFSPLVKVSSRGTLTLQPTSIKLIIGAVTLLVILMILSGFMLEAVACASGVPKCD